MALLFETGVWTPNGTTPQTISLNNAALTPIAIMCWCNLYPGFSALTADTYFTLGVGTRRGGSTQSGCVGIFSRDNHTATETARIRNTTLLHVPIGPNATHFTVDLTAFATGSFSVSYSSTGNSNNDRIGYCVWGGSDLTDAIVLNWTMDATSGVEAITGAGFQGNVLFALDTDLATTGTFSSNLAYSFGVATSSTQNRSIAITATTLDSATSTMNWNKATRSDACLERLTINADTTNARWALSSFDSDGASLTVVDAPTNTDRIATFLLIKGGTWEAGSKAKETDTGTDIYTLANASVSPVGALLTTTRQTAVGITAGNMDWSIGASDGTRLGGVGATGSETINTNSDRYISQTHILNELVGGTTATVASSATLSSFAPGSFTLNWAVNGGSVALINYLVFGDAAAPSPRGLSLLGVGR